MLWFLYPSLQPRSLWRQHPPHVHSSGALFSSCCQGQCHHSPRRSHCPFPKHFGALDTESVCQVIWSEMASTIIQEIGHQLSNSIISSRVEELIYEHAVVVFSLEIRSNLCLLALLSGFTVMLMCHLSHHSPCACTLEPPSHGSLHRCVSVFFLLGHWSAAAVTMLHWTTWWEKFTLSITTSFNGRETLRWSSMANLDICLEAWSVRLPWEPAQRFVACRKTHPPLVNPGWRLRQGHFETTNSLIPGVTHCN